MQLIAPQNGLEVGVPLIHSEYCKWLYAPNIPVLPIELWTGRPPETVDPAITERRRV